MKAIGLMSGTSADALDIALVEIVETEKPRVNLLKYEQVEYPEGLAEAVHDAIHSKSIQLEVLANLNIKLGEFYGEAVLNFLDSHNIPRGVIKIIGSHGQTIFHRSKKVNGVGATLQIGDGAIIAKKTEIPVVSDFRIDDIAVGGEGAPLTPYFHYILFRDFAEPMAVVNIGGIANITFIPPDEHFEKMIAFDSGPGNSLLDLAVTKFTKGKFSCDLNGEFSSKGKINKVKTF